MILYIHAGKDHKGPEGEALLKRALFHYAETKRGLSADEAERAFGGVRVLRTAYGKPYFAAGKETDCGDSETACGGFGPEGRVFFSVSHSGGYWVCLMADEEVGVDIQEVRTVCALHMAERFFTSAEAETVRASEPEFFRIWVRKEAYIKYTGTGLSQGLATFSVLPGQDGLIRTGNAVIRDIARDTEMFGMPGAYCSASGKEIEGITEI